MTRRYYRPIAQPRVDAGAGAIQLAGTPRWFSRVEVMSRGGSLGLIDARDLPDDVAANLTAHRAPVCGVSMDAPRLMGVVNVTPDSFSDGGRYLRADAAFAHGQALADEGADFLDVGGESTRPGAAFVPADEEIARIQPVIAGLKPLGIPISSDTRKSAVAQAALSAGAGWINDVSALGFDPDMAPLVAGAQVPICLMHAQGDPETMQEKPIYDNVLLDVFDFLEARMKAAMAAGIAREAIVIDPGIGFGKTLDHNLTLLRGMSLFHGLGCPILLGVSRKRFIGTIGQEAQADRRAPGSIAVALEGARQGVQITRVHDMAKTRQAVALWAALN